MPTARRKWTEGEIEGLVLRTARKFADSRGWLAEIFRSDELGADLLPTMSYVSVTHPGVTRGPHEHTTQTDLFAFLGPGDFHIRFWDDRPASPTYGNMKTTVAGACNPTVVMVPPGIVHGYTNVSSCDAWVVNCPNRLYAGKGRKEPVDEVRYEDKPESGFVMGK